MKEFKYGGASLRHAAAIKNAARIVEQHRDGGLLVVGSAIGKTTNALEKIVELLTHHQVAEAEVSSLEAHHIAILDELFQAGDKVYDLVREQFASIRRALPSNDADSFYDEIVSKGELVSTLILSHYLKKSISAEWIDARAYITTDNSFREGKVDWPATLAKSAVLVTKAKDHVLVTQGFIGRTPDGKTTTLGREGSDYTAAIFGYCLHAESVTIWKDVPGVMNADPKRFDGA
jgi:aspartate kinase